MEWFKKYKDVLVNTSIAIVIGFVVIFFFTIMFSIVKKELFKTEPVKVQIRCNDVVYLVNKENISKDNFLYSDYDSNNKFDVLPMEGCSVYDKN